MNVRGPASGIVLIRGRNNLSALFERPALQLYWPAGRRPPPPTGDAPSVRRRPGQSAHRLDRHRPARHYLASWTRLKMVAFRSDRPLRFADRNVPLRRIPEREPASILH